MNAFTCFATRSSSDPQKLNVSAKWLRSFGPRSSLSGVSEVMDMLDSSLARDGTAQSLAPPLGGDAFDRGDNNSTPSSSSPMPFMAPNNVRPRFPKIIINAKID